MKKRMQEGLVATATSHTGEKATVYASDEGEKFEVYIFPAYGSAQPPKFLDGPLSNVVRYLKDLGFDNVDSPFEAAYESYEFSGGNVEYGVIDQNGTPLGSVFAACPSEAKEAASEKFQISAEFLRVAVVSIDGEYVSGFPRYEASSNRLGRENPHKSFLAHAPKRGLRESGEYKIPDRVRSKITNHLIAAGFDGNGRFSSPSEALAKAQNVLSDFDLFLENPVTIWELERAAVGGNLFTASLVYSVDTPESRIYEPVENTHLVLSFFCLEDFNLSANQVDLGVSKASADYPNAVWEVISYLS